MSGIAAFAGTQAARDFLLVQTDRMRLEGRQTAGIGLTEDRRVPRDVTLFRVKQSWEGPEALRRLVPESLMSGSTGIAQVCSFSSDLVPKDVFAPVFQDRAGDVLLAFEGAVDEPHDLHGLLTRACIRPKSSHVGDTLAEYFASCFSRYGDKQDGPESLAKALKDIRGKFVLALIHHRSPTTVLLASQGRYLAYGKYRGDCVASSCEDWNQNGDVNQVQVLEEGAVLSLSRAGYHVRLPQVMQTQPASPV